MSTPAPLNESPVTQESAVGLNLFQNKLNALLQALLSDAAAKRYSVPPDLLQHLPPRLDLAFSYFEPKLKQIFSWLYESAEHSNFTYPINESNKEYLAALCAVVLKQPTAVMRGYIAELENDIDLRRFVHSQRPALLARGMSLDAEFDFGRRLGWYVIARALKPKIIVETGVAQGLGSLVLTTALLRNANEGHPGYYYGTDLEPKAGFLLQGPYRTVGTILYGDSIESLKNFNQPIDLFINDSDHSAEYEAREYQVVASKLSPRAVILGDNSHVTDKLCEFAKQTGRQFLYFQEKPKNHWYPGAGIGISFPA